MARSLAGRGAGCRGPLPGWDEGCPGSSRGWGHGSRDAVRGRAVRHGFAPPSRTQCPLIPSASRGGWGGVYDLHPLRVSSGVLGKGTSFLQCCRTRGLVPQFPHLQLMVGTCAIPVMAVPLLK